MKSLFILHCNCFFVQNVGSFYILLDFPHICHLFPKLNTPILHSCPILWVPAIGHSRHRAVVPGGRCLLCPARPQVRGFARAHIAWELHPPSCGRRGDLRSPLQRASQNAADINYALHLGFRRQTGEVNSARDTNFWVDSSCLRPMRGWRGQRPCSPEAGFIPTSPRIGVQTFPGPALGSRNSWKMSTLDSSRCSPRPWSLEALKLSSDALGCQTPLAVKHPPGRTGSPELLTSLEPRNNQSLASEGDVFSWWHIMHFKGAFFFLSAFFYW